MLERSLIRYSVDAVANKIVTSGKDTQHGTLQKLKEAIETVTYETDSELYNLVIIALGSLVTEIGIDSELGSVIDFSVSDGEVIAILLSLSDQESAL
jgi:hypothetical protein